MQHGLTALGRFNIDSNALFVAVEGAEKARPCAQQTACAVAAYRLDLDDFGAKVAEDHAARRAHDHMRNLNDTDAVQGKSGHCGAPLTGSSGVAVCVGEVERQSGPGDEAVKWLAR
ncbi:hypothetical protein D3C75_1015750 [compost metagenome]